MILGHDVFQRHVESKKPERSSVDTAAMTAYADSLMRAHWTQVCNDSIKKWDSIKTVYGY